MGVNRAIEVNGVIEQMIHIYIIVKFVHIGEVGHIGVQMHIS